MLSGDINGKAVQAIRANSHRVLGKYTASGTMTYCPLNDENSNYYHDGTAAVLTGAEGDVFVKLPTFYYKIDIVATEKFNINLQYGGKKQDGWKEWDTNALIGVYKGYVLNNKLYSRSGVTATGNLSYNTFKAAATNRGSSFSLIQWGMHCIISMLFFCQYGHTNIQAKCGLGYDNNNHTVGGSNSLGMRDTVYGESIYNTSFWGIEDAYGHKSEFMDNAIYYNSTVTITEDGVSRTVPCYASVNGWIRKVYINEFFDITPRDILVNSDSEHTIYSAQRFCDYAWSNALNGAPLQRSGSSASLSGGITTLSYDQPPTKAVGLFCGTRLAFRGTCVEQKNVAAFKALTAIA